MVCPNKNLPQWRKMVESLGENLAYYHFAQNNYDLLTDEQIQAVKPRMTEEEIKFKLMTFMQNFGFDVSTVPQLLKEKGYTIKALVDLSNKAVKIYNGASNVDWAEESAHIALELLNGDQTLNRAIELAKQMPEYKDVYTIYKRIYSGDIENKAAKEVIAKRIAKHIFNQQSINNPVQTESRFISTIKQLWRKFTSLFNKPNIIDELTSFINNIGEQILSNTFEVKSELSDGVYYSAELNKASQILTDAIERISKRRNSLRTRSVSGGVKSRLKDDIAKLKDAQDKLEEEKGLIEFLNFLPQDINEAKKYIGSAKQVSSRAIRNLKDFIDYYEPILDSMRVAINKKQIFNEFPDEQLDKIKSQLSSYRDEFQNIKDFYVESHAKVANNIVTSYLAERGVKPDFNVENIFGETTQDAWQVQYWFGSIKDTSSPIARLIYGVVGKAKLAVEKKAHEIARNLVNSIAIRKGIRNTSIFAEKDKNGNTTGYFLTQYKMDEFIKAKDKFKEQMNQKYNLSKDKPYPIDPVEQVKYNKDWNEWKSENIERRFTSEYYKLRNNLSIDAEIELAKHDALINELLYKFKDKDGNLELHKMSDSEWNKLKELKAARTSLSTLYYEDGTKKSGVSLRIAQELNEWKRKRSENVSYKRNIESYNNALASIDRKVASGELSNSDRLKWIERNTQINYSQEFWDKLSSIEKKDYGEEYKRLSEEKNDILRPYRNSELEVDMNLVGDIAKTRIKEIDQRMIKIVKENKKKTKSEFNEIANVEVTNDYRKALAKAKSDGKLLEFMDKEHYEGIKGDKVPHSYWTHIVPKNKSYIIKEPSNEWTEVDKDSIWYNKNFDQSWRGMQPKKSKYSNEDFNKLTDKEKEALKELITLKHQMDDKIIVGNDGHYLLPQISQSLNDAIMSRSNLKDSLKEFTKESWQRRQDDTEFGDQNFVERPDGSKSKFVPIYYTRKLEDPKVISTDILSSMSLYSKMAINYEEMNKVAPEIEVLKEQVGQTRIETKTENKLGIESNIYKMIERFMDVQLYGMSKTNFKDMNILGININTAKAANNINRYIKSVNLMFSLFTTLTGNVTGFINARMSDIIGRYTTIRAKNLANIEFLKLLPTAITEWNTIAKDNKLNVIAETYELVDSFEGIFDNLDKNRLARLTGKDIVYSSYQLGDYALKVNTALAVMYNYRYYEGKFYTENQFNKLRIESINYKDLVSIYDMYEVKDHKLVPKKEYEKTITDNDDNYIRYTVKYLSSKFDGSLTELDKSAIHYDTWGQLVATHRNWLFGGVADRFKKRGINFMTGEVEVGYHRETWSIISQMFVAAKTNGIKGMLADWNNLDEYQKEALYKSLLELSVVLTLVVVAKLINKAADDEDDNWTIQALAYLSNRTLLEASSLSITPMPLPYNEVLTVLGSPIAGTRQVEALEGLFDMLNTEIVESGTYEGYTKQQRAIMKLIPGFKGIMQSTNPEASNQFIINKQLKQLY